MAVAAAQSGLKDNTTLLRELTLEISQCATIVPSILTNLHDHPLLQRLCMCGYAMDLTRLENLMLSDASKITELNIQRNGGPVTALTPVLQALARRPNLTKLGLHVLLGCDEARQLGVVLCHTPSLQSLTLNGSNLGSAGLAELAPALYHNTSIEVLDMAYNELRYMESARLLRDILRSNNTITTLSLCANHFGLTTGAVDCIAEGLGSNSTLLKIDLGNCSSLCSLGDDGVSILAQTLGSRNTTLQKLSLGHNSWMSPGVGDVAGRGRVSRNDGIEQPLHHGSRPPGQPSWKRGSKCPNQVFGKQRVAKPQTSLSSSIPH
jgi:hypothetical protein